MTTQSPSENPAPNMEGDLHNRDTAAGRYEALSTDKLIFVQRARQCARVTVPYAFPPQGHSSATTYFTPFQSVGADCLNNLTAKLMLVLFPPGEPFFKLTGSAKLKKNIRSAQKDEQDGTDMKAEFEKGLGLVEQDVTDEMESHGARVSKTEAIQQLLVSGNALIQITEENKFICHHLENYVVRRDVDGHPIELVIRQTLKRQSLPEEALKILYQLEKHGQPTATAPSSDNSSADRATSLEPGNIDLFTWARIEGTGKKKKWEFHQEILGHRIPDTDGEWPLETPALIPLVWRRIQGEHYGRGFVEQYLGDLNSLEALSQTLIEGASIAGRVRWVVDETGLTKISDIANAANGAFVHGEVEGGKPKNIAAVQLEKTMDFKILVDTIQMITERLNRAFLRVQTRDAERVTAEEVRQLAKELEAALGGAYAMLAQEFQRPIVRRVILNMQKSGALKHWPKDMIRAEIVAGLEGLGREQQIQKLSQLVNLVAQAFGPQAVAQAFNLPSYFTRLGTDMGIDMDGLVKSQDQMAQEAQQQNMNEMQQKLGPHMIKAASDQAKSMRENPDSPVDKQPGGALGAVRAQAQGQIAPHAAAGGPQPPGR